MRIAHLCLAAFYIDGYGYQENILPRVHKRMGHEVEIIASTETYVDKSHLGYVEPSSYWNEDGIRVHRLAYSRWLPRRLRPKIRAYEGLREKLDAFAPDLIFLHDVQFWDVLVVCDYAKLHKIPVHADSHTDYVNSARSFTSRHLLHGLFYKALVQRADRFISRYFPTLPLRADFMAEVYGLPRDKMELLPFGFDDTSVPNVEREEVRRAFRGKLNISCEDTVFVTGGKLDLRKNIHDLIDRFSRLRKSGQLEGVHLIVFGEPNEEVASRLSKIAIDDNVHMVGWIKASELYSAFWAADMAIFPGTHSVVWEEAIAHGLGAVFRRWVGMGHLDVGGNARFIDDAQPHTLDRVLLDLTKENGALMSEMNDAAQQNGPKHFSFSKIAEKAIAFL